MAHSVVTDAAWAALGRDEREQQLEHHRVELTGFCYRMLGSAFDAEDAVQETLLAGLDGSAPIRSAGTAPFVALPHRDQRVHQHAQRQ